MRGIFKTALHNMKLPQTGNKKCYRFNEMLMKRQKKVTMAKIRYVESFIGRIDKIQALITSRICIQERFQIDQHFRFR